MVQTSMKPTAENLPQMAQCRAGISMGSLSGRAMSLGIAKSVDQAWLNNPLAGRQCVEVILAVMVTRGGARIKVPTAKTVDYRCCDWLTRIEADYGPLRLRLDHRQKMSVWVHLGKDQVALNAFAGESRLPD